MSKTSSHYFSDTVAATEAELKKLEFSVRGFDLQMYVADQVFSATRLDPGTKVLLSEVPTPPQTGRFLDLGCGWGVISTVLAKHSPSAEVWAVDVNERALELTKLNCQANGYNSLVALKAPEALAKVEAEELFFDLIWSNPPIRVGKAQTQEILLTWLARLAPTGEAWLVVAKNLGADSLTAWLNEQGFVATKEHSKKGFRIIRVTHR
ncbi:class I SAM-dependent methyltransferase [Gleimia sp. 6138-11-ORH1]|uniref:class I SAM-dependent methyltransferase n=1 Tax=Gleimia sp. 6138-11-ORH1 TaxID=2973937 RepID=UPI0021698DA5|nr:class I SAM-dependent methyltransferase [Gleimia sp. 6138-11-ORH1]MCS4484239.1 class I SAM-dependent methyltransferase [Gleimia sp. 6138-11-ORH1]